MFENGELRKPVISSACPAVVRLIRTRFPNLLSNLLPTCAPIDLAAKIAREKAKRETDYTDEEIGVFFITPCPAKRTAIRTPLCHEDYGINGAIAIKDIYPVLVQTMDRLQPEEVEAINEKYKNPEDAMAKQQALMALYRKVGVSPMGGCLPMLLSWPVLLALFYFFPNSIELRGQSFLWAHDLSTYDSIFSWDAKIPVISWIFGNHISLFCVLMTATNIIYTKITMSQNAGQQTMPGMKLMMYGMPIMFFVVLNDYSAGLSYYYFLSTLLGIIQTYLIRASVNDDKLLQTIKENMKNPKKAANKGGGWIAKMQEIQRRQEQELRKQRERQQRRR